MSNQKLYLSSLAAVGSASATLLALSYFKPTNLGQNDLQYNWKKLSLISSVGSLLTIHYGVTGKDAFSSTIMYLSNLLSTK